MESQSTHESGDAIASALPNDAPLSAQPMAAFGSLKRPTALGKSAWNEESTPKGKRTNRFLRASLYVSLGLCSFVFFLYLTFPYGVLKEVLVSKITESIQKSGYPVRVGIGSLRPNWITGIQAENVIVSNSTDSTALLKLGKVTARINLLPLLIGQIGISAYVSQSGGYLDADLKIPIFGAIKGAGPKFVQVNFKSFSLDPIFKRTFKFQSLRRNESNERRLINRRAPLAWRRSSRCSGPPPAPRRRRAVGARRTRRSWRRPLSYEPLRAPW